MKIDPEGRMFWDRKRFFRVAILIISSRRVPASEWRLMVTLGRSLTIDRGKLGEGIVGETELKINRIASQTGLFRE
ncbi:MAG: hypothetical protein Q4D62_10225 [Planctomycetia bacterium]|nr:hypothetical protein [Planctomycetia bacterium]